MCECGCPIDIKPYKGGESFIEILEFAEIALKVAIHVIQR